MILPTVSPGGSPPLPVHTPYTTAERQHLMSHLAVAVGERSPRTTRLDACFLNAVEFPVMHVLFSLRGVYRFFCSGGRSSMRRTIAGGSEGSESALAGGYSAVEPKIELQTKP